MQTDCKQMEHVIEFKTDEGFWEKYEVEAPNWNQALQKAPERVRDADDWRIYIRTELISKNDALHTGVIDEVLPE